MGRLLRPLRPRLPVGVGVLLGGARLGKRPGAVDRPPGERGPRRAASLGESLERTRRGGGRGLGHHARRAGGLRQKLSQRGAPRLISSVEWGSTWTFQSARGTARGGLRTAERLRRESPRWPFGSSRARRLGRNCPQRAARRSAPRTSPAADGAHRRWHLSTLGCTRSARLRRRPLPSSES